MKKISVLIAIFSIAFAGLAQKLSTRDGVINFESITPVETIKGENRKVSSVVDIKTGDIVFSLLVKSFDFSNALMEEHFNENYMESDKFPKSTFKGKITNISSVDFTKDGTYNVTIEGKLTMHNVTKDVKTTGVIKIVKGVISASSTFQVSPKDYGIVIPAVVNQKISESININVNLVYKKM